MEENKVRELSCKWLKSHFPKRHYFLKPIVFHGLNGTVAQYLHKKYKGSVLIKIPLHSNLVIRPDIIAILKLKEEENENLLWIIGECKPGSISSSAFRQLLHYANVSQAYEAYMFFTGKISGEVEKAIKTGGDIYNGTNHWGKKTKKRLILVKTDGNSFRKISY